jgi:putative DNA primase/helicase
MSENDVRAPIEMAQEYSPPPPKPETDEEAFARLAKLSPVEYDRTRKVEAKRLEIQVSTLDDEVSKHRPKPDTGSSRQGRALNFDDPEPWSEPVDGSMLLSELAETIKRLVFVTREQADAIALWICGTWVADRSEYAPRLGITSAEKGCGKTTLLDVISRMVQRCLLSSGISSAAVARTVEAVNPTLLIDEADTFLPENEDLRGILNSGHKRGGAVIKCTGEDFEPRAFNVHCWASLAAIGRLPGTLEDRAIKIEMLRAKKDERPERITKHARATMRTIASKLARFVDDNAEALTDADPALPDFLFGRAADNWRTMFAIANAAGGEWPDRAAKAAMAITGGGNEDAESHRVKLLGDVRTIFEAESTDRIQTSRILELLAQIDDRPWAEWSKGKPMTAPQLAKILGPFNIKPTTVRIGATTHKGYRREEFDDAFERYLSPSIWLEGALEPSHRNNPQNSADFRTSEGVTLKPPVTALQSEKPKQINAVTDVTPETPETGAMKKTANGWGVDL